MSFPCYSEEEGLEKCEAQCFNCKCRYQKGASVSRIKANDVPEFEKITLKFSGEVLQKLLFLAKHDNRTLQNLLHTIILNQLDVLDYDFTKYLPTKNGWINQ